MSMCCMSIYIFVSCIQHFILVLLSIIIPNYLYLMYTSCMDIYHRCLSETFGRTEERTGETHQKGILYIVRYIVVYTIRSMCYITYLL